jgi:hypothetical protein
MPTLAQVTSAVSLLAMATSLWLGCYIVTRSPRSRLAWLAGITLCALAGFFVDVLISTNPSPLTVGWQGWPICFSLVLWYHLSLNMLPPDRGQRQRRFLVLVYAQAIVVDLLLTTPLIVVDARQTLGATFKVLTLGPLFLLLPISTLSVTLLTLDNFWTTRQTAANPSLRHRLNSPVRGSLLALLAVAYTMLALGLRLPLPTLPMVVLLALGVASLGYGVVRYSALVDGRVVRYDFAINGLLILAVTAIYFAVTWIFHLAFDLPIIAVIVIVILVVVTHAGFDFARRWLDWPYLRRPERALRAALHSTVSDLSERKSAEDGLRSALTAIVAGIDAEWGAIALRAESNFTVRASYHWKSVGERLPDDQITVRELTSLPTTDSAESVAVIAPFMVEGVCTGAILLGQPKDASAYSQDDLDLVAEAADRLAELSLRFQQQAAHASEIDKMLREFQEREHGLQQEVAALRSPAKHESVSPVLVAQVEDALRRLYDYAYLGDQALGERVLPRDQFSTHLDRGKALNALLITTIEKLRPPVAVEPRELPAREWHPYLILRDAYVRCESNRDIMSRLYVSEATFHRTRRSALRAVTQAILELDHPAV